MLPSHSGVSSSKGRPTELSFAHPELIPPATKKILRKPMCAAPHPDLHSNPFNFVSLKQTSHIASLRSSLISLALVIHLEHSTNSAQNTP